MGLLYMVIDKKEMKVLQLGAMDVIASKQFLEDPTVVIDLSPVSCGSSYSCYSREEIALLCTNCGLPVEGSYGDQINSLREHLVKRYKEAEPLKALEYYEGKLSAKMKADPEFYKQFEPETPESVKSGRFSATSSNASNKPKSTAPAVRPAGGTTKKVWDIADEIKGNNPSLSAKELRPIIIKACEEQEINASTAGTQFAKWKNSLNWE